MIRARLVILFGYGFILCPPNPLPPQPIEQEGLILAALCPSESIGKDHLNVCNRQRSSHTLSHPESTTV